MDHRVQKVITLMEEHLHRGWPAGRLAGSVNLSPSRLHQLFKEETGLPPARYLRLLRMRRAKELLESSYLSVKEVMARVGAADESHFVRDFRKAHGSTPAQYRRRFLERQAGEAAPPPIPSTAPPLAPEGTAPAPDYAAAPPLLLRRTSHPRYLAADGSALRQYRRRRELLALLSLRHAGFAQLTTALGASIAREMPGPRVISYRPRRSAVPRRPPPSVERPQTPAALTPRSPAPRRKPSAVAARRQG